MKHPRYSIPPGHLLVPVFILLAAVLYGQDSGARSDLPDLDSLLPGKRIEEIRSSEENGINRFFTSEEKATLSPASELSSEVQEKAYSIDYSVGVESLFLIPNEKIASRMLSLSPEDYLLELYTILRSISTLEGIEYYSASRDRMRLLFEESWVIESPQDPAKLPDPADSSIPDRDTLYIHQKDLTFGKSMSKVVYRHEENALSMSITNETTMRYMFFPLLKKGNVSMQMLILPVKEGIVFYGLSTVDVMDLKVFHNKMRDSFTNRLNALKDWFISRVGD
ncbi:MAG: DUF6675 family protein [Sediminispirochaetaceae bacterium]